MSQFVTGFLRTTPFSDILAYQVGLPAFNPDVPSQLDFIIPGTDNLPSNIKPPQKYRVLFSYPYDGNVWVGYNLSSNQTPIVLPGSGGITLIRGTNVEFRPDERFVKSGDVLSFVSTNATFFGFSLLTIPG